MELQVSVWMNFSLGGWAELPCLRPVGEERPRVHLRRDLTVGKFRCSPRLRRAGCTELLGGALKMQI